MHIPVSPSIPSLPAVREVCVVTVCKRLLAVSPELAQVPTAEPRAMQREKGCLAHLSWGLWGISGRLHLEAPRLCSIKVDCSTGWKVRAVTGDRGDSWSGLCRVWGHRGFTVALCSFLKQIRVVDCAPCPGDPNAPPCPLVQYRFHSQNDCASELRSQVSKPYLTLQTRFKLQREEG